MITVLIDISWGIFAKSTLQYAVRTGVRRGITLTKAQVGSSDLTATVKGIVQSNSFGLLSDTSLIHVHYLQPPDVGSTAAATDVSTVTTGSNPGNSPGNIMVVSVDSFSMRRSLIARIYNWRSTENTDSTISVVSADLIEPMNKSEIPPLGTAP